MMNNIIIFNSKESKEAYEGDIRALVNSFYPHDTAKAVYVEEGFADARIFYASIECLAQSMDGEREDGDLVVTVSGNLRVLTAPVSFWENESESHAIRRCLKALFYKLLCQIEGRELPWGSLTGVRPVRLMAKLLKEKADEKEAVSFYQREYLVGDEKTQEALDIAKRQLALIENRASNDTYSLYIGIPFCPTTCLYCSFTSYPAAGREQLMADYLRVLRYELEKSAELMREKQLTSIYVGGGTPSAISAEQIDELLSVIKKSFDLSSLTEITFEAGRPDSITKEKLSVLKSHGVNRISVNPQTMKDETLKLIGRHHSVQQTIDTFMLAREMGFDDINMDLILGLPGESYEDVKNTLEKVKELKPDSLTIHSLAIKRGSRLHEQLLLKQIDISDNHITQEIVNLCKEAAKAMNMKPYYLYRQKRIADNFENTGYARDDKYCFYNIVTMEEVQNIVACGAGTVSKRVYGDGHIERCDNVKDVELYISKIEEMVERKRELFAE